MSCCAHRNILIKSCLVRGDSFGAGGSSCCGRGGHSNRLPPLSWKRLLRDPVRAPDVMSCPEEASASELSPGGLPVPVGCPVPVCLALVGCPVPVCLALEGCPVPVCLALEGCPVPVLFLSCPVCLAPEGT